MAMFARFHPPSSILHPPPFPHRPRRGTILVAALWAMIILAGVTLLFARSMRVEVISANNRVSAVQAAAIVRGAEQYVIALAESAAGDPSAIVEAPAESLAVGEDPYDRRPLGYFWLIKPDPGNTELTAFGLVDENSKIDLGSAPPEELLKLPGMTNDVADAIVDWRDPDGAVTNQGAENEYYMSLPQPYNAKNDRLESVEELRLVKGMTEEILFGWDRNRDGILDAREQAWGGTATAFNAATGAGRGIAPFVTVYSTEPAAAGTGLADVNGDAQQLQEAMAKSLPPDRVTAILQRAGAGGQGGGGPGGQPGGGGGGGGGQQPQRFSSVFEFAARGGMTPQELRQVYDSLSASVVAAAPTTAPAGGGGAAARASVVRGRLNLNTAPREAIACLTGLEQQDVENLVGARQGEGTATSSLAWVYEALGPEKAAQVGSRLTNKSYQYSADIVAVTANGKSFKRVRIVVDGRQTPARIVYRKDVTDLGWPLDEAIRQTLREGGVLETPFGTGGGSSMSR